MKPALKVGILSLGCPRNIVDSETVLARLNIKGYPIVEIDQADIAIINTCAFTEEAKRESVDAILDLIELKKEGKLKKILVYGCLSQRYRHELKKELPEVDAFVGKISLSAEAERFPITPKHYAYLKICEGCINNCSFCVIPKIKGAFASLGQEAIIAKVRAFDKERISELNVVGQDITGWGLDLDKSLNLAGLVRKIEKQATHIGWIRLLYLYPSRISDELLEIIRSSSKICKYIDVPIQHINDRILKLMDRKSSKKEILAKLGKIRKAIPGVALRTSVIVGFPSETDREFKELLGFLKEARFERLGAFIYSREEGTKAHDFKGQVDKKIKVERFNAVMSQQQRISEENNKQFLNSTIEVLIDEKEGAHYLGRSQYDAPEVDGLVYVRSEKKLQPGDFVKVKINDTLEYDLTGEAL
jgi:ribosomal protein S12 methylthiotransferase